MWSSCWQVCDAFFPRAQKERLVKREKLAHLELLDPPVAVDPQEMMVPRVTLYVSSSDKHSFDLCIIRAVNNSITLSYFSVELFSARAVVDKVSNIWVKLSLLSVPISLQGPVGFPGDPGPPGEPGAAVSVTFTWCCAIMSRILYCSWTFLQHFYHFFLFFLIVSFSFYIEKLYAYFELNWIFPCLANLYFLFRVLMDYLETKEMMEKQVNL